MRKLSLCLLILVLGCGLVALGCGDFEAVCGNGVQEGAEACDDGNTLNCDGLCNADCSAVVPECVCGNGLEEEGEACDDGNTLDCDGPCSGDCTVIESGCGDGVLCGTETCDDGFTDACGTCNSDCSGVGSGATCGDGSVCPEFEDCDDEYTDACGTCNELCTGPGTGSVCGDDDYCPETEECDGSEECSPDCRVVTKVSGIFDSNTTWSEEENPIYLTDTIQTAYGTTLTLEPGVVVEGNGQELQIFGALAVEGTEEDPVVFDDVVLKEGSGPSNELFEIDVNFAVFESGQVLSPTGSSGYGSYSVRNSVFDHVGRYSSIHYPTSSSVFEGNIFIESGVLSVGVSDGVQVLIQNNVFIDQSGNTHDSAVRGWACSSGGTLVVRYNSFLSTDQVALEVDANGCMSGSNNFWNSEDTGVIDSMIRDNNDDLEITNEISYTPILSEPHEDTPDPSPWLP